MVISPPLILWNKYISIVLLFLDHQGFHVIVEKSVFHLLVMYICIAKIIIRSQIREYTTLIT